MSLGLRPLGVNPLGLLNTPAGGTTYNESVSDSLTLTDSATAAQTFVNAVSDSLTLSDSAGAVQTFNNTVSDTLSLSDSATSTATYNVTASDDLTLTDAATADQPSTADTHDGDTWRQYRKSLRNLAKLAEERRRAKDAEAGEVRREILAVLDEAKGIPAVEVREAVAEVREALPGTSERQIRRVDDWTPILRAVERLEAALAYERMLDEDDEEVLLLI